MRPGTNGYLYFLEKGNRLPVPEWVYFYINLGLEVSSYEQGANRLIVALAVPTRTLAAALVAFGVTVGASKAYYQKFKLEEHLKQLLSLQEGAPIVYLRKNRQLKGKYLGHKEFNDGLRLCLELEQGTKHWILANQAASIRAVSPTSKVQIPKHQRGRRITRSNQFLSTFLDDDCANDLLLRSKLMCTVVGRVSLLREEIVETQFAAKRGGTGALNEILRVQRFVSTNSTYRSHIVAADKEMSPETASAFTAPVIVFDGSSGFLKWHRYWNTSSWIVLLDRTERNFDPAVTLLNQHFVQNRVGDQVPLKAPGIPPGVEAMVYEETCK